MFVWKSVKPASTREYIIKGGPVTRGISGNGERGLSDLGGMGAGQNTFTKYRKVDFENPVYLGNVNIFYKVNNGLPKFNEKMFSVFSDIPRV